jgi:hypothetical protein
MFGRKKRLSQPHKRLAVQVARDKFSQAQGNKVEFERLVREDSRVKMIDPALIALFIQVAMAIFSYFKNRQASNLSTTSESDDDIYLGSIRFEE